MKLGLKYLYALALGVIVSYSVVYAADPSSTTLIQDKEATYLAEVISIKSSNVKDVPNTDVQAVYKTVVVHFLSGDKEGKTQTITDSGFALKVDDKVYVRYTKTADGSEYYSIQEPYRVPALLWLAGIFVIAVLIFGGKQGFLALVALFISFGVIFKLLFPGIIQGDNIILIATTGALTSLFVVMYMTHGFTRLTTAAFLGCSCTVLFTLLLAKYAVHITALTGFSDEESVYLNIATKGNLDFVALLVGGIIIGVLGVVDDVAITQASVVNELHHANPSMSMRMLYGKALKVGKDHMGAVINTLILAYTGASLPLILLLYISNTPTLELINREAIATEIVRSIVGSVGLLLAVPLTTLIAVFLMYGKVHTSSTHTHHH